MRRPKILMKLVTGRSEFATILRLIHAILFLLPESWQEAGHVTLRVEGDDVAHVEAARGSDDLPHGWAKDNLDSKYERRRRNQQKQHLGFTLEFSLQHDDVEREVEVSFGHDYVKNCLSCRQVVEDFDSNPTQKQNWGKK